MLPTIRWTQFHAAPQGLGLESFAEFLQSFIPIKEGDVPFFYHTPREPFFHIGSYAVQKVVLSITPTKGVYDAVHKRPNLLDGGRRTGVVALIHRPFNLNRRRLPRELCVVLSSHKSLDEVLTTGWNVQLARRLGVLNDDFTCIQGYKNDPDRRIGLAAAVNATEKELLLRIWHEFKCWDGCFGFTEQVAIDGSNIKDHSVSLDKEIKVIASMNAFHPEEIDRVIEAAIQAGHIRDLSECSSILYLTGAVRQPGLDYALEKGLRVVCVGHKACEDWGMRFLAEQIRTRYPQLEVVEVDEPEEPVEVSVKNHPRNRTADTTLSRRVVSRHVDTSTTGDTGHRSESYRRRPPWMDQASHRKDPESNTVSNGMDTPFLDDQALLERRMEKATARHERRAERQHTEEVYKGPTSS